jgi:hypothetical protein
MSISEKDIFLYVFFREKLSDEKLKAIKGNKNFEDEINFYESLRDVMSAIESEKKVIVLKPVYLNFKKYTSSMPRFAAASVDLTRKTEFTTFTDEQSAYLCRLIRTEEKNLLYIISGDEKTDKKVDVTIYPSEQTFHLEDLQNPILLPDVEINLIHLVEV